MRRLLPGLILLMVACGQAETATDLPADQSANETADTAVVENIPDGDYVEHYQDGSVKMRGTILNGKRYGTWVSYHANGNKASENHYTYGNLNGKTVSYYKNGQIRYIGYYAGNEKSGIWKFFKKDGSPDQEVDYSAQD